MPWKILLVEEYDEAPENEVNSWVQKSKDKLGEPVELDKCPEFCKFIGLVASWQIICVRVKMYWNKYKRFFLTVVPKQPRQRQYIGRSIFEDLIRNTWKKWQALMIQMYGSLDRSVVDIWIRTKGEVSYITVEMSTRAWGSWTRKWRNLALRA